MIEKMTIMKNMMRKKEAECPDETYPVDMEEGLKDINDDRNKNMIGEKRQSAQMKLLLLI